MKNILLLVLISFIFPSLVYADWPVEEAKINYLFMEIQRVEGRFIRNGEEYSPDKAVDHLKMKLENALNSWFTPDKETWTAEMFIEKIASKSSFSGKAYQLKLKGGKIVYTATWLDQKLKIYRSEPQKNHKK